ncbi:MAG TPA: hypothetical protein EYQ24_08220 [Bacteroidetes bacterium]|nr:hypothetical protein [Bacteroidota bacterium]
MTTTLLAKVDSWWKALSVIAAAVAVGVGVGIGSVSYVGLPARVTSNALRIDRLEDGAASAEGERAEIQEGIDALKCMWLADRRETPIEDCL